jgi:hypothetical protein
MAISCVVEYPEDYCHERFYGITPAEQYVSMGYQGRSPWLVRAPTNALGGGDLEPVVAHPRSYCFSVPPCPIHSPLPEAMPRVVKAKAIPIGNLHPGEAGDGLQRRRRELAGPRLKHISHRREKIMSDIEHRYYRSFA